MSMSLKFIIKLISDRMPMLPTNLRQAGITEDEDAFIKKTLFGSFFMSFGIIFIVFIVIDKIGKPKWILIPLFPLVLISLFSFMIKLPQIKITKINKEISREIVYAGRFLVIELESGVPLYDSFLNIVKNYPKVGKCFNEIINKVEMGTPMEDAINESIQHSPSPHIQKILWQIINSIRTGSDISTSIDAVMEQIVKEQVISMREYGKKLNPLAMFYMMIAVIIPTLGTTLLVVMSTFVSMNFSLTLLMTIVFFLAFMQLMFLNIIKSSRPPVDM